jgi:hypothetical protein
MFLILGMSVAGWLAWSGIAGLQKALTRVVVPGSSELTLDEPGGYTIFHEPESVVDGRVYSVQSVAGLRVTVVAEPDGTAIPTVEPGATSRYAIGSHSGVSILSFDIAQPGRYRLTAEYAGGRAEPQTVLAIGHGFVGRLLGTIFGAIGAVFVGFGAALALALTTYFRRRRLARAAGA